MNESKIKTIGVITLVLGGIGIIYIAYFGIAVLHSVVFVGEEMIPDHECEKDYFLAFSNTDNQWLCGKCKTVTFGNQEYNCKLEYKPATKKV